MAELSIVLPTVGSLDDSRSASPLHTPHQLGSQSRTVQRQSSGLRTSPRPKKAAKSKWRRASRLAKLNAYVDNEDAFVKEGHQQLAEANNVVTEVDTAGCSVNTPGRQIPLWQQGDTSMYGTFKLGTRAKLRTNPLIIAAIDAWWEVVLASLQAQGQLGAEVTATDRLQATVDKAEYVRIGRCLFKALMPVWDEADAQLSAEDDWEQDAKGEPTIDRRSFGESMFQVSSSYYPLSSRPAAAGLPSAVAPPPRRRPSPRAVLSWWTCGRRAPTPRSTQLSWTVCLSRQRMHRRTAAPPHRRTIVASLHRCTCIAAPAPLPLHRGTAAPPRRCIVAPLHRCSCTATPAPLHLCTAAARAGDVHARP